MYDVIDSENVRRRVDSKTGRLAKIALVGLVCLGLSACIVEQEPNGGDYRVQQYQGVPIDKNKKQIKEEIPPKPRQPLYDEVAP